MSRRNLTGRSGPLNVYAFEVPQPVQRLLLLGPGGDTGGKPHGGRPQDQVRRPETDPRSRSHPAQLKAPDLAAITTTEVWIRGVALSANVTFIDDPWRPATEFCNLYEAT